MTELERRRNIRALWEAINFHCVRQRGTWIDDTYMTRDMPKCPDESRVFEMVIDYLKGLG
jgi:hypothetical protein